MVARMKRRYGLCLRKALQPLLAPALTSGSAMVSKTYSPCEIPEVGEKISKCQKGICHPEFISGSHIEIPKQVRNDKKVKAAFTLAEVLITLAIIGIVAAMTIPTLVSNYQKKQTVVKLKQAYALLQQLMQFSVMENGSPSKWDYDLDNISFINKYFAPYVKIMGITDVYDFKSLDGNVHGKNISQVAQLTNGNTLFYLPHINGTVIWLTLIVDLNGKSNPNIVGKDIFVFSFVNDKLTTYDQYWQMDGMSYSRNFLLIPGTSGQCNPKAAGGVIGAGSFCSRLIEMDGWEIKDDYPWD